MPDASAYRGVVAGLLAAAGVQVTAINWIAPSLEDVFISAVAAA